MIAHFWNWNKLELSICFEMRTNERDTWIYIFYLWISNEYCIIEVYWNSYLRSRLEFSQALLCVWKKKKRKYSDGSPAKCYPMWSTPLRERVLLPLIEIFFSPTLIGAWWACKSSKSAFARVRLTGFQCVCSQRGKLD